MLQRQIMFKQLQELQRRQQFQELSDTRNQDYANQLSLKRTAGGQSPLTVNGTPIQDSSQMFMVDNLQTLQQGESTGLVLSQSHNLGIGQVGLPQPQFGISLDGTHVPNADKNFNQHSQLQGPSNLSVNLLTKNNSSLGMAALQPSAFGSSFTSQQCNFSPDQISMRDGLLLSKQVKNLFGQVPIEGLNSGILTGNYSQQGIPMQRNDSLLESEGSHQNSGWDGLSPRKTSKLGLHHSATSLDPLEQKILYDTDDNIWESSLGRSSKMSIGGLESTVDHTSRVDAFTSIQSGSWSALMQSAAAETYSSDTGAQEEWSGLSFQNPEPLNDDQPLNIIDSENLQTNWVDRNLQNASSPSSEPKHLIQNFDINCSFPNSLQSWNQFVKQKEEYLSEAAHASTQNSPRIMSQLGDYKSQQKLPTGVNQLFQTSVSLPNVWPGQHKMYSNNDANQSSILSSTNDNQPFSNFSGNEFRGMFSLQGSPSHKAGGIQKPCDQVNELNRQGFSVEPENITPGKNLEAMSTLLDVSLDHPRDNMTASSESMLELLNKDDIPNDQTPAELNANTSIPREFPLSVTSVASSAKPCNMSPASPDCGFRLGPADPRTSHSYSFPQSMGNTGATSLSGHNVNDYIKNQHPAPLVPSHMAADFQAYRAAASQDNSELKVTRPSGPTFPLLENASISQPSLASDILQHLGFQMGLTAPWPDMAPRQDASSPKPHKFSSLFQSPDSASSNLVTSSGAPNEQSNNQSFQHEYTCSGKSEHNVQQLEKENSHHEGLTEINNSTSLGLGAHKQELMGKQHLEAGAVVSGSFMSNARHQPSNQADGRDEESPSFPARDIGAFDHSLSHQYSLLQQLHTSGSAETDGSRSFPPKYDGVNYQQSVANVRQLFMNGQKSGLNDRKSDPCAVSRVGASWSGDNNRWNFSQEAQGFQLGKDSSMAYHKNFQQMGVFGQNDTPNHSIGYNEASNIVHQSQICLQMAPSWFKHYGTLKNGRMVAMDDSKAATSVAKPSSEMAPGNLQENRLIMQLNLASSSPGSGLWPSSAATSTVCKKLNPSCMLPSDVTCQKLDVSVSKKRKLSALDMVPWHNQVNCEPSRLLDISNMELVWAQALNRKPEEVTNDPEIVEELIPRIRAKRRLICTTQLMQQIFRPAPAVILCSDVSSNCDCATYSASRLTLADVCRLTGQLPSNANEMSPDKLKTSETANAYKFSNVVEGFNNRFKELEGVLSRLEKSSSIVDIKVEAQELEKFSILNRFAKFHIKAYLSTVNPASSSGTSTFHRTNPQRYVIAVPMPQILPEETDCFSL